MSTRPSPTSSSAIARAASAPDAAAHHVVLTVLLPFGAGYFLANLLRTINAIIAPNIAGELQLSAAGLGGLTAGYFLVFALAQLPVGIALDRWGARSVSSVLLTIAAIGTVLFALAQDLVALALARGLIGLGVSGCLMAALKANAAAWPPERLPMVNGLTAAMGMLGSLASTVPVEILVGWLGWRVVVASTAPVIIGVAAVIYLLTPSTRKAPDQPLALGAELQHIWAIARDRKFLRLAVPATIHTGTYLAYQSLWAGPWLRDVSGLDSPAVAVALFAFNLGMLAGTMSSGWIAGRLALRNVPTVVALQGALLLSLACQGLILSQWIRNPTAMFLAFGFCCSMWFLVYAVLGQTFGRDLMGRVGTLLNMMIFTTAFIVQWAVGAIISLWPMTDAVSFSPVGHQMAFGGFWLLQVIAVAWLIVEQASLRRMGMRVS